MKTEKYAVIGIGQFGSAIAKALSEKGGEVMAIDTNSEIIDSIADDVAYAVVLDATDQKALMSQNITDFDAVVVAIGQDFEQLLLCSVTLMELGVKRIIARAMGPNQKSILEKIGIEEILSPEDEVGIIVAERLINPNVLSYLQLPDNYRIAEIKTPRGIANRTLGDIDVRDNYKLSLITIKREFEIKKNDKIVFEQHIEGVPNSRTIVLNTDTLVVFGKNRDIDRFIEINQ
ncbi:MAG: TrkA family potassium uptake protein [Bacteroidota bacterium]